MGDSRAIDPLIGTMADFDDAPIAWADLECHVPVDQVLVATQPLDTTGLPAETTIWWKQ